MRHMVLLWGILVFMSACATPQGIKETSRQQRELIREFQNGLGELRTKLLVFYDEEIEGFKQDLLQSRMGQERVRVSQRAHEAILKIDPTLTKEQRIIKAKEILDTAANYLTELPEFYFDENYCTVWPELKKGFLREPDERCRDDHIKPYQRLLEGREEVAQRFDRLVTAIGKTGEAHDLVNEFLQIEFRLTREQVDEAKKVIEEAHKTLAEAKAAWAKYRENEGGNQ